MSFVRRTLGFLMFALVGCNGNVRIEPEGYRCDEGNTCPTGFSCRDGVCHAGSLADPCAGISCNNPPENTCVNATTARTFAGHCSDGQCLYEPSDSTCTTACDQGACLDACMGMACLTPPSAACTDANTLRTFSQTGTCTSGLCDYARNDVSCPNGCENGGCKGADLCTANNVVCDVPPAAVCVGTTRRSFIAPGTCQPTMGTCTFSSSDMQCPNGCALGQCLTASLTFTQTGPRLRFAVNAIDVAPGSSGNSALVVGNGGKVARWDGAMWAELPTPATRNLNSVAFVSGTLAYIVGAGNTAWTWRSSTNQMLDVALSATSTANLVAVSGRSETEVLIASSAGEWWRMRGGLWGSGSLPSFYAPFDISSAYLDESFRDRLAGSCGIPAEGCIGYRYAGGATRTFVVHEDASTNRFTAVGGSFIVPTDGSSFALVGADDTTIQSHSNIGFFDSVSPSPSLKGSGIAGITAQATGAGRDVFVLTSSRDAGTPGGLYRLVRPSVLDDVTSNLMHETRLGEEVLSPNDATGVLVAEVRRAAGVNSIFRVSSATPEALDLGEDFVGASIDNLGALVLANRRGDVFVRRPSASTFALRRPVGSWVIQGMEARHGSGALLVGRDASNTGLIVRAGAAGFTTLASAANVTFNAVCRVSDNEGWAVGTGGAIYQVKSTGGTAVVSPTTKDLLSVDCSAGVGVAVGTDSTVLRLTGGVWVNVSNFPMAGRLLSAIRLSAQDAFVVGDGVFYKFSMASGSWAALPSKAGLSSLVVAGPQEVYGSVVTGSGSEIFRFDGTAWNARLLQVSGVLGGGVQAGAGVVWGGTLGVIVEAR